MGQYAKVKKAILRKEVHYIPFMGPGDEGLSKKTGVQSKPKEDSEADEINGSVINSSEETDNGTW